MQAFFYFFFVFNKTQLDYVIIIFSLSFVFRFSYRWVYFDFKILKTLNIYTKSKYYVFIFFCLSIYLFSLYTQLPYILIHTHTVCLYVFLYVYFHSSKIGSIIGSRVYKQTFPSANFVYNDAGIRQPIVIWTFGFELVTPTLLLRVRKVFMIKISSLIQVWSLVYK